MDVAKAFYAGAAVQIRSKEDSDYFPKIDEWEDCTVPEWSWGEFDYRVIERVTMTDDLTGDKPRIKFLRDKVEEAKKNLKYWEELVTHETCLMNGIHYKINSNKAQGEQ